MITDRLTTLAASMKTSSEKTMVTVVGSMTPLRSFVKRRLPLMKPGASAGGVVSVRTRA